MKDNLFRSIIIVLIMCVICFIPKTHAVSFQKIYLFDSSFNVLGQYDVPQVNVNVQNVKYLRCSYTEAFTKSGSYNAIFTYSVTAVGNQPYMVWNNAGLNINGSYVKSAPASQTVIEEQTQGANSFYRQLSYPFSSWNQSIQGNFGVFVQLELQTASRITYFSCDDFLLYSTGDSGDSSAGTQQIINNNNQNTQQIINNNNTNTQNIVNAQEDTTQAIEDVNDTLQDVEVDDDTIGDKVGEIEASTDTPISDLLTLPLTLLQKLYNSLNSSCSSYTIPFGFGVTNYTLSLPCFDLGKENLLGRVVWGTIDDVICIFIFFSIAKMAMWFYSSWTTLSDNFLYLIDPSNRGLF